MKVLSGVFASFDGMCWTIPTQRMEEIVHKVHYGQPSKGELNILVGAVGCYAALLQMPERLRRVRIRQLREAMKLAAVSASEKP